LIVVSIWLANKSRKYWFAIIPAILMMITTLASLLMLLFKTYLPKGNWPLAITDIALLALSVGVIIISVQKFTNKNKSRSVTAK